MRMTLFLVVFSSLWFLLAGQKILAIDQRSLQPNLIQKNQFTALPTSTPIPTPTPVSRIEIKTPVKIIPLNTPTPSQAASQINRMPSISILSPSTTPTLTPTPAIFELRKTGNEFLLGGKKVEKLAPVQITLASTSATLTAQKDLTILSFESDSQKVELPIRADFIVKDDKLTLVADGKELPLKFSPVSFYAALQSVLVKGKSELIALDLQIENGKPIYSVKIKSKLKLLGFIPYTAEGLLKVNAANNKVDGVNYGLLTKMTVLPDFNKFFIGGPELEIRNVRFEPLSYKEGSQVVIRADLHNKGTEMANAGVGNHVKNWLYFKDKQIYGTNEQVVWIDPGHSQQLNYVWSNVVCGAPISLIFDPDRVLAEENTQTTWYGTTSCAPDHGPDLTVSQIKFEGLSYGGKNPGVSNKVSYVISNIGEQASEPVKALAKAGDAQYLSIISIPAIQPYGFFSGDFNYTPTTCDPVDINIDTQGLLKSKETNRDNNDVFEDKQVTDWCKVYPKLQFDLVYWKVNGYSFAKSKLPNGSYMNFEVDVGNLSWDGSYGCAHSVIIRVEINGQFNTDVPVGNVGSCTDGGAPLSHLIGDTAHPSKHVEFNLGPACGDEIKFTIDPDHVYPEFDRSDNTWTHKVECE